ncbi:uncharacterized protein BDV17DRAFT_272553 [Aspergillus undulatus]|uniref:uncharacterized protein n=1 Tax=Aspergillus undulatus TaxID=1810928 RepID=UPI003CCCFD58
MPQFIPPPPNPSIAGSHPPSPTIPVAPPPWTLRAKAWTFLYSDVDKNNTSSPSNSQNPNNNPSTLQSVLPDGAYHPSALEKLPSGASQFNGKSWLKAIMIVRYEDTDVGPYDELILLPGRAVNPYSGSKEMRISTIYVSTDASVWNGRRNWSAYTLYRVSYPKRSTDCN